MSLSLYARRVLRFLAQHGGRRLKDIGGWVLLEEPSGATVPGHVTADFFELWKAGEIEVDGPAQEFADGRVYWQRWRITRLRHRTQPSPTPDRRCTAQTAAYRRCRGWAVRGTDRCSYHSGWSQPQPRQIPPMPVADPSAKKRQGHRPPPGKRCTGETRDGSQCRRWSLTGSSRCHIHQIANAEAPGRTVRSTTASRRPPRAVDTKCRRHGVKNCPNCAEVAATVESVVAGMRRQLKPTF